MKISSPILAQPTRVFLDSQLVETLHASPDEVDVFINRMKTNLWMRGYLFAQEKKTNDSAIYLAKGDKLQFKIDSAHYNSGGTVEGWKPVSYRKLGTEVSGRWYDRGYPFASFQLKIPTYDGKLYHTSLSVSEGPFIVYDSLILLTPLRTSRAYLRQVLAIQKDHPFNESNYQTLSDKLQRLPYLRLKAEPDISFSNGEADIYLDLSETASNTFEGVLGILPNQAGGGVLVTGYLDLKLRNMFRSGKELSFVWNRFGEQSQSLDLSYAHPYFLNSALLLEGKFSLLKQDTSFVNQRGGLSVGAYIGTNTRLMTSYAQLNTSVLTRNESYAESQDLIDFNKDAYGISLNMNNYDWAFDYQGGLKLFLQAELGSRKTQKNPNFSSAYYDSLARKTTTSTLQFGLKGQRNIFGQTSIFNGLSGGWLTNPTVFNNEAFRLGGFRTVRGFNENQFYASKYFMNRLEVRQYFERESYFMLLCDQLWYQNSGQQDYPFGLGVGFALNTRTSLFNFAIAVGKSKENPMSLSTAKVHFGYISRF